MANLRCNNLVTMTTSNITEIEFKPVEIFCGTGGVGKTTIATSRAINLATKNKSVLLITIDPAKRLKDILGLSSKMAGNIEKVQLTTLGLSENNKYFDALLMNPESTISYIAKKTGSDKISNNQIIKTLTKPYGGMNEILSIVELKRHLASKEYDSIILDTPPGKHFIDFLFSCNKINDFFDNNFIELFKYLGKKPIVSKTKEKTTGILSSLVTSGAKKIIHYLEGLTGTIFIEQFIDAVEAMHLSKDIFLEAVKFSEELKLKHISNWFLVTSAEQSKLNQANLLKDKASSFLHNDNYLIVNKCISSYFSSYLKYREKDRYDPRVNKIIDTALTKEKSLISQIATNNNTLKFPEIIEELPREHVLKLTKVWENN